MSARRGTAPTVEKVAEAAAVAAVRSTVPKILAAVAAEVARAVEPAVVAAVQQAIREAVQKAVAGATGNSGGAPVVSFGMPAPPVVHQPAPTGVQGVERVPIRTGNLAVDRMLSGGARVPMRESDFA